MQGSHFVVLLVLGKKQVQGFSQFYPLPKENQGTSSYKQGKHDSVVHSKFHISPLFECCGISKSPLTSWNWGNGQILTWIHLEISITWQLRFAHISYSKLMRVFKPVMNYDLNLSNCIIHIASILIRCRRSFILWLSLLSNRLMPQALAETTTKM